MDDPVDLAILAALSAAALGAYAWTQTRYFVGADTDTVVIYRGIQQDIGPISLSSVYEDTGISLNDLPFYQRLAVTSTISARSLSDAEQIVDTLRTTLEGER